MDLFSRYLLRQALSVMAMILLSLTGIVWIATALRQLNLMTSQGQDAWTFLQITFLALPNLMAIIAPIALLITVIHTLNKANQDSELIVMTASGATVWWFARPFVALATVLSVFILIANLYILPWSVRTLEAYVLKVRTDLISQVLQPGQFSSPEQGLTFHIRSRESSGDIRGMIIHDERDDAVSISYLADRARVVKRNGTGFLIMRDGHIVRREAGEETARIIAFQQNAIDLSRMSEPAEITSLKPRARYLHELTTYDADDWRWQHQAGKFRSELHERFSSALYPFVFVFVALAHLGVAQTNRTGRTQAVVIAFAMSAGARLLGLAANNLTTLHAWAMPLMYVIPLGAIAAAILHAHLAMRPRRKSAFARRLEALGDAMTAAPSRLATWVRTRTTKRPSPTVAKTGEARS